MKENGSVNASIITHNDKMYCRKRSKNFWTLQYVLQYSAILKMGAKKPSETEDYKVKDPITCTGLATEVSVCGY